MSRRRFLTALAGLPLLGAGGDAPRIVTWVGQDLPDYQESRRGFEARLRQGLPGAALSAQRLSGDARRTEKALTALSQAPPALLHTLGTTALEAALRADRIPIVAGMVLDTAPLVDAGVTSVVLRYSPGVQLDLLMAVLPRARTVGLVYSPSLPTELLAQARASAAMRDLTLEERPVSGPHDIPTVLPSLTNRADVLWGLADPTVYTATTSRTFLMYSFRSRIPLMGPSPPWVSAGALFSPAWDHKDLGEQSAELALRVLAGEAPPPEPPRRSHFALNQQTARQLKIDLSAALRKEAHRVY